MKTAITWRWRIQNSTGIYVTQNKNSKNFASILCPGENMAQGERQADKRYDRRYVILKKKVGSY